jgi:phenylpropionate dioxygenase-like ring-hydroxylating dioxygenase large terminal subunit
MRRIEKTRAPGGRPEPSPLPIADLLEQLGAGPETARTLPPWVYTDPRFHALEQECIFSQEWLCIGRADALRDTGDFVTARVAGEPVIVMRTESGSIEAMSNVCRHRMSTLLEGRGNVRRIVCPYHAWTYDLHGRLCAAAAMERSEIFDRATIRLPAVRCAVWLGWLFVMLDAAATPPAERFAEVASLVGDYGMDNYVETFREEFRWDANWKLVAENFMESYHLPVCHAGTVGRNVRLQDLDGTMIREAWNCHRVVRRDGNELTVAHPANERLVGDLRRTTWVLALYPTLMITLTPGYFWYLCLSPDGSSSVDVTFGGGMAPEFATDERAERLFAETRDLTAAILKEDRVCVERVHRGLRAALAAPGPLSHLEAGNHAFARWIVGRLPPQA